MNGVALCAGVGGLELAIRTVFPNYRCIAGVESNPEAAQKFRLRHPEAKVFRNVVGFDGRRLHGIVDCVSAGWPCQPHSVAGKRLGTSDERWIWDDIARIVDESGAGLFFGENVSGLLRDANMQDDGGEMDDGAGELMGGMGTVLRDLASMGFISVWGSLRASGVGAGHGRPRVFLLAYHPGRGEKERTGPVGIGGRRLTESDADVGLSASSGFSLGGNGSGVRELQAIERTGADVENSARSAIASGGSGGRRSWEPSRLVPIPVTGLPFWARFRILRRLCRQLQLRLPSPYRKGRTIFRRKLNPDFVDWLMGWPPGWSSAGRVFSAEETELYLCRLRASMRSLVGGSGL